MLLAFSALATGVVGFTVATSFSSLLGSEFLMGLK